MPELDISGITKSNASKELQRALQRANESHAVYASALAMPEGVRVADQILTRSVRQAEAWRLFVAYAESKAKAGDREAADLMLFVDSGGAA